MTDLTLTISTENEYLVSREQARELKHKLSIIDDHHKGAITQYKAYKETRKPVEQQIKDLKAAQKVYLTNKRLAAKSQAEQIENDFLDKRTRLLHEQADKADQDGDHEQASMFREIAHSQTTAALTIEPERQPETMTTWGYEIVDITKLKPGFAEIAITPLRKEILKEVRKYHQHAEAIVGLGSIRVFETVVPVDRKGNTND